VLDSLRELGIDYDEVVQDLEDDGVAKFDTAWQKLGEQLAATLRSEPTAR
jgi:transaldolase